MKIRHVAIMSLFLGVVLSSSSVYAEQNMVMVTFDDLDEVGKKTLQLVYTEAFQRLGYKLVYREYPGKRASLLADQGAVDGELARTYEYAETHPNLIRVEESTFSPSVFVAYATDSTIRLNGWESLRNTDYKVEHKRGVQMPHTKLMEVVLAENLSAITRTEQGLKKLLAGRTDVYIDSEYTIMQLLQTKAFKGAPLHRVGVMGTITNHAYLHFTHKDLARQLSAVLRQMKAEGLIAKYIALSMQP